MQAASAALCPVLGTCGIANDWVTTGSVLLRLVLVRLACVALRFWDFAAVWIRLNVQSGQRELSRLPGCGSGRPLHEVLPPFWLAAFGRLPLRVLDFGGSVIPASVPLLRALLHWDGVTEKVTRL